MRFVYDLTKKNITIMKELQNSVSIDEKGNARCSVEITDIWDLRLALEACDQLDEYCEADKLIYATAEKNGWTFKDNELRQISEWKNEDYSESWWDEVWCADKNGNLLALAENGWEVRVPQKNNPPIPKNTTMKTYLSTFPWEIDGKLIATDAIIVNDRSTLTGFDDTDDAVTIFDKCARVFQPELWVTKGRNCVERVDKTHKHDSRFVYFATDDYLSDIEDAEEKYDIKWGSDYDCLWLDKEFRISIIFTAGIDEDKIDNIEDLYEYCSAVQFAIDNLSEHGHDAKKQLRELVENTAQLYGWETNYYDKDEFSCDDGKKSLLYSNGKWELQCVQYYSDGEKVR